MPGGTLVSTRLACRAAHSPSPSESVRHRAWSTLRTIGVVVAASHLHKSTRRTLKTCCAAAPLHVLTGIAVATRLRRSSREAPRITRSAAAGSRRGERLRDGASRAIDTRICRPRRVPARLAGRAAAGPGARKRIRHRPGAALDTRVCRDGGVATRITSTARRTAG